MKAANTCAFRSIAKSVLSTRNTCSAAMSFAALVILCGLGPRASATTYPSNTTYYISNSSCNNSYAGTSSSQPWCNFTNVNGNTFSQGDQILLQSGSSWSTEMTPLGNGVSGDPITIGCYNSSTSCTSNYPVINAGSSAPSIYLVNPSYWTVTNQTLTGSNNGILVNFTQLGNQGLIFQNLYCYNLNGSTPCVVFSGMNTNPPTAIPSGQYIISGVTFSNIGISNAGAIDLTADYANAQQVNNGYPNAQQNILIKNVTASDYKGCFAFANAENIVVMDSFWQDGDKDGSCGAATYMVSLSNVTFNNGINYNDPFSNGSDNAAFVYDNQETQIRWRGDYFYKNAASGIEGAENLCFANCTASTNSQFEVSSSTFYDNSTQDECTDPSNSSATYGFYGDISVAYSPETQMAVKNNLYSDTSQSCNAFVNRLNTTYQTLTNNTNFGSSALYNSASQYSGTQGQNQWSYYYWSPSTNLVAMAYQNGGWSGNYGSTITQFDMLPPNLVGSSSGTTIRLWTAPRSGTVQIRGWALMNTTGGGGVQIGISGPSGWIWPNSSGWTNLPNDTVGEETPVSNVVVNAGDSIGFWVNAWSNGNNSNDVVSWVPSITYTN